MLMALTHLSASPQDQAIIQPLVLSLLQGLQGLDPQAGLDRHLMTRAIAAGKKTAEQALHGPSTGNCVLIERHRDPFPNAGHGENRRQTVYIS